MALDTGYLIAHAKRNETIHRGGIISTIYPIETGENTKRKRKNEKKKNKGKKERERLVSFAKSAHIQTNSRTPNNSPSPEDSSEAAYRPILHETSATQLSKSGGDA